MSRFASQLGLSSGQTTGGNSSNGSGTMWGEKQRKAVSDMERGHNRPNATKASSKVEMDRSESVKGLTDDVIMHTIDYKVEYEDPRHEPEMLTEGSDSQVRW
jgi:hypothetical protein